MEIEKAAPQEHPEGQPDDQSEEDTISTIQLQDGRVVMLSKDDADQTLDWARLARLPLEQAVFAGAYRNMLLAGLDLKLTIFRDCDFSGCDFTGAILSSMNAERATFQGAVLNDVVLDHANLVEANLQGAHLSNVRANSMTAIGAIFDNATIDNTRFHTAKLSGASLKGIAGKDTIVEGSSDLTGCVFDDAELERWVFTDVNLTGCSFAGATLKKVRFTKTNLSGVDFSGVDFKGSDFSACELTGAIFQGAKNVPKDLHRKGHAGEVRVMLRRAKSLSACEDVHVDTMEKALTKLWFEHAVSGGDILTEPFEEVIDAAIAVADALEAEARRPQR